MSAETFTSPKSPLQSRILPASFVPRTESLLTRLASFWHRWDRLQLSFLDPEPLKAEGGMIRTTLVIANPGSRPNLVTRITVTVSDVHRTFTLHAEYVPSPIPDSSALAIDLVASNFQPLRLSRECTLRVALTDRTGKIYRFEHPLANVWSKDLFPDERD